MKRKLLLSLVVALFSAVGAWAQTDVTSTYLTNADFSQGPVIAADIRGYGKDMADGDVYGFQPVDGWTSLVLAGAKDEKGYENSGMGGGVLTYGSTYQLKGNNKSAPEKGPNDGEGQGLGFFGVWSNGGYYYQDVTLLAGKYTLTFPIYCASGTQANETYTGFFPAEGTAQTVTINTTVGEWVSQSVTFTLTEDTPGQIRIGYKSTGSGSGSNPMLFYDGVKIEYTDPLAGARSDLQTEIDKAKLCDAKEGLADAIAAAEDALTNATTAKELQDALAALQKADKDAVLRYENKLADASATNGLLTTFVVNGTFDSNVDGWTCTGGFQNKNLKNAKSGTLDKFWENWTPSDKVAANKMYQTINNIPNGTYRLSISAFVNKLDEENQYVFVNNDKTKLTAGANSGADYEVWSVVTNNTAEIGLEQITATANWMGIDNVSLTYYGAGDVIDAAQAAAHKVDWDAALAAAKTAVANEEYKNVKGSELSAINAEIAKAEPTTPEGYDEATEALTKATKAFIEAKADYDALVAEIAKAKSLGIAEDAADAYAANSSSTAANAKSNMQNLKVDEYNYVTTNYKYGVELGEWVSTGSNKGADWSNEHWSGNAEKYKNQDDSNGQGWNSSAWDMDYNQDIVLPAGNYIFKVAGRQAESEKVNMSMVVKNGDAVLGTVEDFPHNGNKARGIDKTGATKFEGEDDEFANSGNGFGWEWRYVKFTLANPATVNIAVKVVATTNGMWASFGGYTLQTDDDTNISLIAYNIALNGATQACDNEDYKVVTGSERTDLVAAIEADGTLNKSDKATVDAAKDNLETKTAAFVDAKDKYVAWNTAKDAEYADNLPYANSEKYAAVTAAKTAGDATSAADAEEKTNALISAYRKYVESNALAEGVEGAQVVAIPDYRMEVEYDGENHKFGEWQVFGQLNGNIQLLSNQSFTDGDGKADYKYADIYKNDNNAGIQQSINLEAGKYLLTVTARANTTSGATFFVFADGVQAGIPRIGNSGGVFGSGWNDASVEFTVTEKSDVKIGVQSGNGKDLWWSATRFRLVRLGDAPVFNMNVAAKSYATFVAPFDVEIPAGVTASTVTGVDENKTTLKLSDVDATIKANTPVVLYNDNEEAVNKSCSIAGAWKFDAKATPTKDWLTGVYTDQPAPVGSYVLLNKNEKVAFYIVAEGKQPTVTANHAYLTVPEATVKAFFLSGDADGIETLRNGENETMSNAAIYNMAGQRVSKAQKGIYIVNGKKNIIK